MADDGSNTGRVVKQLRLRTGLSRIQLATASGVSASHVTRIENGQRFPSARVLRRIAPHLNIGELELLALAGYISRGEPGMLGDPDSTKLDPYVVASLSREPVEVQRAVISIFSAMKYIAGGIACEQARVGSNGGRR